MVTIGALGVALATPIPDNECHYKNAGLLLTKLLTACCH